MPTQIRVRSHQDAHVSRLDERGSTMPGRFVGRNKRGDVLPGGEIVSDLQHYRRAITRGELELLEECES